MTPALTEILFALGVGSRVVGVTTYCDWPPEARSLPKIGGYVNPSVEEILALRPDLVLVSPAAGNKDGALAVRRAGVRVEVVEADSISSTYAAIERVGTLCGEDERGRLLAGVLRDLVGKAAARVRGLPRVRTLFCLELDPLIAAGPGTLPAEILELAGGVNIASGGRYPRLGIETVLAEAPQAIVEARMDVPAPRSAKDAGRFWRRWPSIPAVRDGRIHVIDATTALRPGPRIADAVERLAAVLHGLEPAGEARR